MSGRIKPTKPSKVPSKLKAYLSAEVLDPSKEQAKVATPTQPTSSFADHRKTNPGLHLLYVKWAVQHLRAIDLAIQSLGRFSNLNLIDSLSALQIERAKLVEGNAAYTEAHAILYVLGLDAESEVRSVDDGALIDTTDRSYDQLEVQQKVEIDTDL